MAKDFDEVEVFKTEQTALDVISGGAIMQRQQTQYVTAVSVVRPRKLADVAMRVKAEVQLDPLGAFYEWDVTDKKGKKHHIEGPTIGLTMSIARNYGNCAVDPLIEEFSTHYLITPVFLDLETGFTFRRAYRQRKSQDIGKFDADRKEDITFQIGQSKAIRNVIKGAVPQAIVTNAIEYAHWCIEQEMTPEVVVEKRDKSIEAFKNDFHVSLERLGVYMGDSDPEKWSVDKVIQLRSIYRALKSGDLSVEDVFPLIEKEHPADEIKLNVTPISELEKDKAPEKKKSTKVKEEKTTPVLAHPESALGPDGNGNYHENGHVFSGDGEYLCEEKDYDCAPEPDPNFAKDLKNEGKLL